MEDFDRMPIEHDNWNIDVSNVSVVIYDDGEIHFNVDSGNDIITASFSIDDLAELVRRAKMFRDRRTVYKSSSDIEKIFLEIYEEK